ncbi:MAG: N-acetyl-gamma-glutamyl-phosphate reductase [Clostridiales bacterium]|nr:N-acetyl-gamma-glutamyl-phosphate reductase [Clostridiales bacterium]
MKKDKIKVGIVGANGYAGAEVMRLISSHPYAELVAVTSRAHSGKRVCDVFPALPIDLAFTDMTDPVLLSCDVVFVALPQTAGAELVGKLIDANVRVIDLSADYRFDDIDVYNSTYGVTHPRPDLNKLAVYGLCEVNRKQIAGAKLVANPGCYVTSVLLPMLPLCKMGLAANIIADSKSGVSGAGRKSDEAYSFCTLDENFKAYGLFTHRHAPEMREKLGVDVLFTPHLLPIKRGILSTVYFTTPDPEKAENVLKSSYHGETFIQYSDSLPEISSVAHTNRCIYSARFDGNRGIVVSVIDNLLKGAAGQAVQNMNIMFGINETAGLPVHSPI